MSNRSDSPNSVVKMPRYQIQKDQAKMQEEFRQLSLPLVVSRGSGLPGMSRRPLGCQEPLVLRVLRAPHVETLPKDPPPKLLVGAPLCLGDVIIYEPRNR